MKKVTILLAIAAFLVINGARAQKTDTASSHHWFMHNIAGAAQIQLTYRQADIGQLNQVLAANHLNSISPVNIWINASMHHIFGDFIAEDGIGFTPVAMSSNNGLYAKYNQYQLFLKAGYSVLKTADVKLYPFAGVNLSAAVLNIDDNAGTQTTRSFSGELLNSTASKTFYQGNFGIELGAGFDYLIPMSPKQTECFTIKRNIPIGIRAGYYINAYAGNWKIDNYLLHGGDEKQSAVFVSLNIGLGYEITK
jgi:hypothetical protein